MSLTMTLTNACFILRTKNLKCSNIKRAASNPICV